MPSLAKTLNGYAPSALPPFAAVSTVVEKNVVVTPVCVRARARSLARSRSTGGGTCTAQGRREGQGRRLLLVSLSEWQWYLMLGALWDR